MRKKLLFLLTSVTGLLYYAGGQVIDMDSLQKEIRKSIQQGFDKEGVSMSFLDSLNITTGKQPVKLDQVFKEMNRALEKAKSAGDINKLEDGYLNLSTLSRMHGNYKDAYENYRLYTLYRDSLQKIEREKKDLQVKMQYEFDKKQAIARAEQEKKDAEARRVKNIQYFTIAGLGGLLLVILLIAFIQRKNYKQKKKANTLLQSEKLKVESALTDLKSAQAQLIQSAKMASLGELTAGIAHEIQNPLNFVNNFSEVNSELIEEQRERLEKGHMEEARVLAFDIAENEKKIVYHGKRADAIVKEMLQHSRTSRGQKEPTDINALCDEYLRLAYHGFRAKDKSFNAKYETHFDNRIGKINVVPEDMGRVILNLINNAFYACTERSRSAVNEDYEPVVMVNTIKLKDKVEVKIKDNGNGIPDSIKEKIFQPFFTTKPTGQGTGLGLSLSYDIVKAHGGEIKVETVENKGTSFIIQIPITLPTYA